MALISAKNGVVSWEAVVVGEATNIVVNTTTDAQVYASSSSSGKKKRVAGHVDNEGTFTLLADVWAIAKGTIGTLLLESITGTTLFSGEAMITDRSFNVDIGTGAIVSLDVTWGAVPTATP
jgi:hypothetical protein